MIISEKRDANGLPVETIYGVESTQLSNISCVMSGLDSCAEFLRYAQKNGDWSEVLKIAEALDRHVVNLRRFKQNVIG